MTPEERAAWRKQHDRELAQTGAAKQLEREKRRERNREAHRLDNEARMSAADAEQTALDELVGKRLGIPAADVPAWRKQRQADMAKLGTYEQQMAKAEIVNPTEEQRDAR